MDPGSSDSVHKVMTLEKVTIPSLHGVFIPARICGVQSHEEIDQWHVQPNSMTAGSIQLISSLETAHVGNPSNINVTIWNLDDRELVIKENTCVAEATRFRSTQDQKDKNFRTKIYGGNVFQTGNHA